MSKKNRFVSLVAKIQKLKSEEGDADVRVRPPATEAQREVLEARFGKPLPAELAELIEVTTGIEGGGPFGDGDFDLDPDEEPSTLSPWEGSDAELVRVFHWGNGDGLYLDVANGACTLWWFGHDPHECVFVARSLLEYFKRLAKTDADGGLAWSPEFELGPMAPNEVSADDTSTQAFLEGLPEGTLVFDLRGEDLPMELMSDWKHREFHRHGEIVARVLSEQARQPPPAGDPEATKLLELALRQAESGEHEKAASTLAQAEALDRYHPGLGQAKVTISAASARAQLEPTREARRRLAEGDLGDAETEPAVVTGLSSVFLTTKHPSLGDIWIFRPTVHTPVKAGDRVRLIGVTLSGEQVRATDYALVQSA